MSEKAKIRKAEHDMALRLLTKLDHYARSQCIEAGLPLVMEGDVACLRELVWSETDEIGENTERQVEANMLAWLVEHGWPEAAADWELNGPGKKASKKAR